MPLILLLFSPAATGGAELVVLPLFILCYLASFQWQEKQGLFSVPDKFQFSYHKENHPEGIILHTAQSQRQGVDFHRLS